MIGEVEIFCPDATAIAVSEREAFRYMGVRGEPDAALYDTFAAVRREWDKTVCYRACFRTLPVTVEEEKRVLLGPLCLTSRRLAAHLSGCSRAVLFAATTGSDVDRLIGRLLVTSPAKALMADALGSAAIEDFCQYLSEKLPVGCPARERFSPGYGDLSLACQKDFLRLLSAQEAIGLSLTDSLMMVPTKSVTALIGLVPAPGKE